MSNPTALVQKLWNYCNILRDDGLSFRLRRGLGGQDGDYVEPLAFLLFRALNAAWGHAAHSPTRSVSVGRLPSTGAGRQPACFQP
jgi:hypothetical protein